MLVGLCLSEQGTNRVHGGSNHAAVQVGTTAATAAVFCSAAQQESNCFTQPSLVAPLGVEKHPFVPIMPPQVEEMYEQLRKNGTVSLCLCNTVSPKPSLNTITQRSLRRCTSSGGAR